MVKLFVVTMYRWGNPEKHSYVLGVFSKKSQAIRAAGIEEHGRGGKYDAEITKVKLDTLLYNKGFNKEVWGEYSNEILGLLNNDLFREKLYSKHCKDGDFS